VFPGGSAIDAVLEYPNSDSNDRSGPFPSLPHAPPDTSRRYILAAPKDPDHYNPIMCLEASLHTICRGPCTTV
jgi:hypothetical protein